MATKYTLYVVQRQTTVTAYSESKQLLLFVCAFLSLYTSIHDMMVVAIFYFISLLLIWWNFVVYSFSLCDSSFCSFYYMLFIVTNF